MFLYKICYWFYKAASVTKEKKRNEGKGIQLQSVSSLYLRFF